jgi:hypothetical protein
MGRDDERIHAALQRMDDMLRWPDARLYALVESCSRWSPAQHLQHVLLALEHFLAAIHTLQEGADARIGPAAAPRLGARAVLATGWIPRGRAQAPENVVPDAIPSRARLREVFEDVRRKARALAERTTSLARVPGTLPHPMLGPFTAQRWLRFARVHTEHHLAIVDDVDRSRVATADAVDPLAPLGEAP